MINYIFGPNTFIVHTTLRRISADYAPTDTTTVEADTLQPAQLLELFFGQSLFTRRRLVVIKSADASTTVWQALEAQLPKIPDDVMVVITAAQPDKRTKTHKSLVTSATVTEANLLSEKQVTNWLTEWANKNNITLPAIAIQRLVERVGTDQWQLTQALEKLTLAGSFDDAAIDRHVEALPQSQVFAVFDALVARKAALVSQLMADLRVTEDPYRFFGLLAQQVFQFVLITHAQDKSADQVAKDTGTHPYPIKKLQSVARREGSAVYSRRMGQEMARLDTQLKSLSGDPWVLLEKSLFAIMHN